MISSFNQFLIICITALYFTRSHCIPMKLSSNFKIDEFIDKLLNSTKFDELANKIAEKAAEKMQKIRNESLPDKSNLLPLENTKYRSSRTEKSNEFKNKADYKSHETLPLHRKGRNNNSTNKIHKESIMSLDSLNPARDISFKYKHFTKKNYATGRHDVTEKSTTLYAKKYSNKDRHYKAHVSNNSYEKKHRDKAKNITQESNENKETNIDLSTENIKNYKDTHHVLSSKNKVTTPSFHNDRHTSFEQERETKEFDKTLEEKALNISIDSRKTQTITIDNKEDSTTTTKFSLRSNTDKSNKSTEEMSLRKSDPNDGETTESSDDNYTDSLSNNEEINVEIESADNENITPSIVVREENGKLFTYEKSSDYDEYHQQLANLQEKNSET